MRYDTFGYSNEKFKEQWIRFGDKRLLRMCGCHDPIPVTLVEDSEGNYKGWIRTGSTEPMLWMIENDFWPKKYYVHSANPVGKHWLVEMIKRYGPYD